MKMGIISYPFIPFSIPIFLDYTQYYHFLCPHKKHEALRNFRKASNRLMIFRGVRLNGKSLWLATRETASSNLVRSSKNSGSPPMPKIIIFPKKEEKT